MLIVGAVELLVWGGAQQIIQNRAFIALKAVPNFGMILKYSVEI